MDVRELQARVDGALLAADSATLRRLVADDCRIIGPRGYQIGKDEWIGTHEETAYEQVRLASAELRWAELGPDAGVVWEVKESACRYHGELIEGRFQVTQVWSRRDGDWQLCSVQYTSISA